MTVGKVSHEITHRGDFRVLYKSKSHEVLMRYSVHCPSAPYENSSFVNLDDCWDLCLDLSEEYGYAEVRHGICVLGSYTNGA